MKCIDIQVLLFVICIAKSLALSSDELEDFTNFLKESSLLDQPLKKNPSDEDDDDIISDHAWEDSGRFEGDLILNDRQRQLIVQDIAEGLSRNGLKDSTKRWPNNEVIVFIQREHFSGDQVEAIVRGMEELSQASCIKFRPYRKGDRDAVVVQGNRRGCFSQVGYQSGYQVLNLSGRHPVGRGCFRHGTVVHEFLHTLGFYHMQSSPDRDDYVDVLWQNINQPARHNFRKYNLFSVSDFGVGYDYDSVLHYSRKAFSSNGGDTLVPKRSGASIGQRVGLSDKDTAKLNKMYCDADSNNFEAADDVPHPPVIKKKKTPKNRPFEGHGIGYHQGKTVVFKLPATETYRLPKTPSNQVFDYFSKAPQAMPPTLIEGFGVGKKITYSYNLPAGYRIVERSDTVFPSSLANMTNRGVVHNIRQDYNLTQNKKDVIKPSYMKPEIKNQETNEDSEKLSEESPKNPHSTYNYYTDVFKPNTDYSQFYTPENKDKPGTKIDYYLNYSPESKAQNEHRNTEITNLKLTRGFIERLGEPKTDYLHPENKNERAASHHDEFDHKRLTTEKSKKIVNGESNSEDVDISFLPVYPYTKLKEIKSIYNLEPEYLSKKYLENKHDFSSLYNPTYNRNGDPHDNKKNAHYTLFGDPVPVPIYDISNIRQSVTPKSLDTQNLNKEDSEIIKGVDGNADEEFASRESSEKIIISESTFSQENKHDLSSVYSPHDNKKNAHYTLFGDPVPVPIYDISNIRQSVTPKSLDTQNLNKEDSEIIKGVDGNADEEFASRESSEKIIIPESTFSQENKHDLSSVYSPHDNKKNAHYTLFGDPVPVPIYDISNIRQSVTPKSLDTQNLNKEDSEIIKGVDDNADEEFASRESSEKIIIPESTFSQENKHDLSSVYSPHDNKKNAHYTLFGDPVPIYGIPNIRHSETTKLDTQNLNKEDSERIKGLDGNADEEFASRESSEKIIIPEFKHSQEDSSKSYEVTEKVVEQIAVVTEKSNPSSPEYQVAEHSLEKRLPAILEGYVNYDNYDITSPYVSRYHNDKSFRKY